jgi:putative Holliday junction resolvase
MLNVIVGFDIGEKRIGVAVSDELLFTAQSTETIKINSLEDVVVEIEKTIKKYDPMEIVIGLPKMMNGEIGVQAQKIIDLVENLKRKLEIKINLMDERLSTVSANRVLIDGNLSRKKRKGKIDSVAASFILQNYLDARKIRNA